VVGTTTIAVLEIDVKDETTTDDTAADDEASGDDEGLAITVAVGAIAVVVDVPVITPENAHVSLILDLLLWLYLHPTSRHP
jgi:hypothetical protein